MRNYEDRAKDFIKLVFPYIEDVDTVWDARTAIQLFNVQHNRKVKTCNGIARIALVTSDYVVKFDYDEDEVAVVGGGANEVIVYNIAKQEGFDYLLAKVTPYEYNGRMFYIMPRIRGIGKYEWDEASEHMTPAENNWCITHHITDLHCNNYGFRNGHVCLIDYACSLDYLSSSSSFPSSWS